MRLVADTNIWVSGLLWGGKPEILFNLIEEGEVMVYVSPEILAEIARVLGYRKFQKHLLRLETTVTDLLELVHSLTTLVETPKNQETLVVRDPTDDIFLHAAIHAKVNYLISGDDHLLSLKEYRGIPIVTVHKFLQAHFPEHL